MLLTSVIIATLLIFTILTFFIYESIKDYKDARDKDPDFSKSEDRKKKEST